MSDQLFDTGDAGSDGAEELPANAPLAVRMRPRTLDEMVGQEHIVGEGSALRAAIESGRPHSAILYGPPGAGKTTLARIAARMADGAFEEESAVNAGKAEIRGVIERARERRRSNGRGTVLFLDEIHRFNKAQQDALLPAVEEGLLTLIGATTENPYFEVNSALISRSQVYELAPLSPEAVEELLRRALADSERGIADPPPISDDALAMLAERSGGDARVALLGLERAVERADGAEIDIAAIEDAIQRHAIDYDRQGDRHYDYISAWIKSTRGSDVDASLYYLAVMLEGGEDPRFIARRMVIFASEDIGNADPMALVVADAAAHAVDRVGLPECALNLSQAAIYLSLAPKSNAATTAIGAARAEVREHGAATPPDALRNSSWPGAKALGRGKGYVYPHDHPGNVAAQQYLPDGLTDRIFYEPTGNGREKAFGERLAELRKRLGRS
jgi:putative ATPase